MTQSISEYATQSFGTFSDLVSLQALNAPDRIAIAHNDKSVTYSEFNALIDRFAASLQEKGLTSRHSVAICGLSSIPYTVAFVGTLRAGIAVAPLAPSSTPGSLVRMITDSDAGLLLVDQASHEALAPYLDDLDIKVVRMDLDGPDGFDAFLAPDGTRPTPVTKVARHSLHAGAGPVPAPDGPSRL